MTVAEKAPPAARRCWLCEYEVKCLLMLCCGTPCSFSASEPDRILNEAVHHKTECKSRHGANAGLSEPVLKPGTVMGMPRRTPFTDMSKSRGNRINDWSIDQS
eukprot:5550826-Karenia_brevis.AAC.1